jgi:DAACS family dicarboxylate/amino acid:cation (Na+ or H+) symporter
MSVVDTSSQGGMPLHTKILIGLGLGAAAGVACNLLFRGAPALAWTVDNVAQPIGQVFLRLLFMIVVPLVFTSLALGVASLGDISRVGRIGGKAIGFFLATTALAAVLGLTIVNVVAPGEALDPGVRQALLTEYAADAAEKVQTAETNGFGVNTFVNIIPRNPVDAAARGDMLALIFFALVFGVALTRIPAESAGPVLRGLEGVSQAVTVIIGFAMKLAPVGVAALIFSVTARFGLDLLQSLAMYVVMVLAALAVHQFAILPALARTLAGVPYGVFFRKGRAMMVTAFSTSSSNATLPTTLKTAESFGVPKEIAGFVVPLGATMNMNGTALFEGMTVLFLAQVFGIELSLTSQLLVVVMSVVTAVGAAGVPGGSIPLLVLVLEMVGVPGEGIALILGVDRILDMSRTVPNVTGDMLTSMVVARSEGVTLNLSDDEPEFDTHADSASDVSAEPVPLDAGRR